MVARDLADAPVPGLSEDRRFAIACEAALQLGKIVIACEGHRVIGEGHHRTTFECLELALRSAVASLSSVFDLCRRKRDKLEFDVASIISEGEADETIRTARSRTSGENLLGLPMTPSSQGMESPEIPG